MNSRNKSVSKTRSSMSKARTSTTGSRISHTRRRPSASVALNSQTEQTKRRSAEIIIDGKNYTPKPLLARNPVSLPQAPGFNVGEEGKSISGGPAVSAASMMGTQSEGFETSDLLAQSTQNSSTGAPIPSISVTAPPPAPGQGASHAGATAATATAAAADDDDVPEHQFADDTPVVLRLRETATRTLFVQVGTCVSKEDARTFERVRADNDAYAALVTARVGSDRYVRRHAQTATLPPKHKEATAAPGATREQGCEAASFDIADAMRGDGAGESDALDAVLLGAAGGTGGSSKSTGTGTDSDVVDRVVVVSLSRPGARLSEDIEAVEVAAAARAAAAAAAAAAAEPAARTSGTGSRHASSRVGVSTGSGGGAGGVSRDSGAGNSISGFADAPNVSSRSISASGTMSQLGASRPSGANRSSRQTTTNTSGPPPPATTAEEQAGWSETGDGRGVLAAREQERVLGSDSLRAALRTAERIVQQSHYHDPQLRFRDLPDARRPRLQRARDGGAVGGETGSGLEPLWQFGCPATLARTVSAMDWNKESGDLLAVSHGQLAFGRAAPGLVTVWSPQNPSHPERVIHTPVDATALAFSARHPSLLAVGLADGTVLLYDVRRPSPRPVLRSAHSTGKHAGSVWQLRWTERGGDAGETLVSVSSDGRVAEWSTRKGLTWTELFRLKRRPNASGNTWKPPNSTGDGIVARQARGLCLDFPSDDPTVYYVGTQSGLVHKCSISYNEEYLRTYTAHSAPVLALRCSPFAPSVFVTASADWTACVWRQDLSSPLATLRTAGLADAVTDAAWSSQSSTVLTTATADGRLLLWDLALDTLNPRVTHTMEAVPLSQVVAAEDSTAAGERKAAASADSPTDADAATATGAAGAGASAAAEFESDSEEEAEVKKQVVASAAVAPSAAAAAAAGAGAEGEEAAEKAFVVPRFSSVLFSPTAPVIVAGDNTGTTHVFRMQGTFDLGLTDDEQRERLLVALNPDGKQPAPSFGDQSTIG